MKNAGFYRRYRFAWAGIRTTFIKEKSFRTQLGMAVATLALLCVLRPEPFWWALMVLASGAVLAAELINTALERVIDRLHSETHPLIGEAKDCAAGAVLVLSFAALGVFAAYITTLALSSAS